MDDNKQLFPIQIHPTCQSKWTWSTLWLRSGTTNSCHRCERHPIPDNFDEFHNTDHKINERNIMLSGRWPTVANGGSGHCEFCKKVEDVGGTSDRMYQRCIPGLTPPELNDDLTAVSVTPRLLEVFLNNTCNLQCVYCNPRDSSKIYDENTRFTDESGISVKSFDNSQYGIISDSELEILIGKYLDWLKRNGHVLKRLHLLGGETFYQKEFFATLDVLEQIKNPELQLNVVSNFMIAPTRFKKIHERIEKMIDNGNIGRYDITSSIDAWGPPGEYARSGLKLDLWEENFSYIAKQPWVTMHINQTISSLTIKTMPELIEKLNYYRQYNNDISHQFAMVGGHQYLHPGNFAYDDMWAADFDKILNTMMRDGDWRDKEYYQMEGFALELQQYKETNWNQVKDLHLFLDEIDRRRNTNWKNVFPYLNINEK